MDMGILRIGKLRVRARESERQREKREREREKERERKRERERGRARASSRASVREEKTRVAAERIGPPRVVTNLPLVRRDSDT